jgi:hypothetical protein
MKLIKRYHSIVGCEVWVMRQAYIDESGEPQIAEAKQAFANHELDYREYVAWKVRAIRTAIRHFISTQRPKE